MNVLSEMQSSLDRQIAELVERASKLRGIGDQRTAQICEDEAAKIRRRKELLNDKPQTQK